MLESIRPLRGCILSPDYGDMLGHTENRRKLCMAVFKNEDLYGTSNTLIEDDYVTVYSQQRLDNTVYVDYGVELFLREASI